MKSLFFAFNPLQCHFWKSNFQLVLVFRYETLLPISYSQNLIFPTKRTFFYWNIENICHLLMTELTSSVSFLNAFILSAWNFLLLFNGCFRTLDSIRKLSVNSFIPKWKNGYLCFQRDNWWNNQSLAESWATLSQWRKNSFYWFIGQANRIILWR